jgi:hypothetical protein
MVNVVRFLGLPKSAAFYRKTAAELAQRHPEIVDALREGKLCLSTVAELSKALEVESLSTVLPRFLHTSKREAKEVLAELKPVQAPPVRDVVTSIPSAALTTAAGSRSVTVAAFDLALPLLSGSPANLVDANAASTSRGLSSQRDERRDVVEPLTADLRRLHLTVDRECLDLISTARDLLSHSDPDATSNDILKAALRLLIADREKKKAAVVSKPRKDPPTPADPDDDIPASVKRAVWKRDEGRCKWPLQNGGTCGCTTRLEFGHFVSRADGGLPTIANLRLLCRFHNQYEARQRFGGAFMDRVTRRTQQARTRRKPSAPPLTQQPCLDLGP